MYALELLSWVGASQEGSYHICLWLRDPGCGSHPSSTFFSFLFLPFMSFLLPSFPRHLPALDSFQISLFPLVCGGKVRGVIPGEMGRGGRKVTISPDSTVMAL